MSSAAAAALTTLAVTVAVPALGDDGGSPPTPDALAACLRAHGLAGAPDGDALKPWLGPRLQSDATARSALEACAPAKPRRVDDQQLRACLADHGIDVPGDDPAALKRWIIGHQGEAATLLAMKACDIGLATKAAPGDCGNDGPSGDAVPGKPADKPGTATAPDTNGAVTTGT